MNGPPWEQEYSRAIEYNRAAKKVMEATRRAHVIPLSLTLVSVALITTSDDLAIQAIGAALGLVGVGVALVIHRQHLKGIRELRERFGR